MTSNIPLMFAPFKYTNNFYIDGAFDNDFAVECLDEKDNALGVYLDPVEDCATFTNQLQYLLQSIIVPLNILSKHQLKKAKECKNLKIVEIPTGNDCMQFKINITTILNKFSKGYTLTKKIIKPTKPS